MLDLAVNISGLFKNKQMLLSPLPVTSQLNCLILYTVTDILYRSVDCASFNYHLMWVFRMDISFLGELKTWLPNNYGLVIHVFVIILVALIANFVVVRLLHRLGVRLQKTRNSWDNVFAEALAKPAGYIIWLVGLSVALNTIEVFEEIKGFLAGFNSLRDVALTSIFGWFVIRLAKGAEKLYEGRGDLDLTTIHAVSKLIVAAVVVTIILFVLNALGYSIKGFLAFGGIGGIALGFAAKDMLANFFGGLVIYFDRPFSVGDWVASPDKQIEGYVEQIGWRSTKIRTFDKRPLYVPNYIFNQISIQNPSRMTNRRIKEMIGVRYEDAPKMRMIVDDIRDMLKNHPDIDPKMTLIVNFVTFAPSSLDIMIYTLTKTTVWVEYHAIRQDVLLKAMDIIHGYGGDVAFPTSTLHIIKEDGLPEEKAR